MRVFAIKDESLADKTLGYLIYYENPKTFYIELPENADPWETPLLLSSFVKRGEYSINSYWSRLWIEQRIIPPDRQNIGQILKENTISEYDAFSLLLLSMGRCAQDACYLEEVSVKNLPDTLTDRWKTKIEDVVPLEHKRLLVFFRNGAVKLVQAEPFALKSAACAPFINDNTRFRQIDVHPDGYGVMWSEMAVIPNHELYAKGEPIPLSLIDFYNFVQYRVIDTAQACKILDCSRQNIDDLVKRGKLHPVRSDARHKLFLKNEALQRKKLL